jgi:hypothetical protein
MKDKKFVKLQLWHKYDRDIIIDMNHIEALKKEYNHDNELTHYAIICHRGIWEIRINEVSNKLYQLFEKMADINSL